MHFIDPDVCRVGGTFTDREIAALAKTYQVAISPHYYNSTVLGFDATLRRAAGMTNFILEEYFVPSTEEGRKLAVQLEAKDSYLQLPTRPGLGVEIDEETLSEYSYRQYPLASRFSP